MATNMTPIKEMVSFTRSEQRRTSTSRILCCVLAYNVFSCLTYDIGKDPMRFNQILHYMLATSQAPC